jgi:hypothetical protein
MPHYHLHLYNSAESHGAEGRDFPDLTAANEEAIRNSRDLIAKHVKAGEAVDLDHRIDVAKDSGKLLASIGFRELITIKDSRVDLDQPYPI